MKEEDKRMKEDKKKTEKDAKMTVKDLVLKNALEKSVDKNLIVW